MSESRVDVIMPTYNRLASLKKTIDSYMSQPELGLFIIVDDCSTDATTTWAKELAQQYPGKIIYHRMDTKSTLPHLRNVGVSLAHAEYIFMGEDDVILPKDHFAVLIQKMQEHRADIIAGRRIYMQESETQESAIAFANKDHGPIFVSIPFEGYFERYVAHAQKVPFIHSNSLMKRSVFEKVQYDPWYGGNAFREELDFYLRVTNAGYAIWLIPDTLSFHLRNTSVNTAGGSRRKRFVYEYQVWKNTMRCFWKNRNIFKKLFGVKHIIWYTMRCLVARYTYALGRRIRWITQRTYEQA
jgi:glycosyltransferase involved in cell wall biosynthesis